MLLWASPRWQLRERLIGTLIWPGGLAGFWVLVSRPIIAGTSGFVWHAYTPLVPQNSAPLVSRTNDMPTGLFWVVLGVLVVVQAAVGIWLLRRARGPELSYPWDSATAPGGATDPS